VKNVKLYSKMLAYATVSSLILSGCGGCGSKKEEQDAPVKLAAE